MNILFTNIVAAQSTLEALRPLEGALNHAADAVRSALIGGGKLLVAGNGGSAGDGGDFSTEFTCRFMTDRRPFPAINLADGASVVTATGNDYGFDEIFARQVRAFGKTGDVLVVITTSGNSANIVRALETARTQGVVSIALLGKDGGAARGLADVELIVPSQVTARIQEAQRFLLHTLCEIVEPALQAAAAD